MHVKKSTGGKLLALFVVLALLIGGAVGGTLAWLIDKTDSITNTFTAGDIKITLDEPSYKTNADGKAKALPGDEIAKDPTVTVHAKSEACYVRMFMLVNWSEDADDWFKGADSVKWYDFSKDWTLTDSYIDETPDAALGHVLEFRYKTEVPYSEDDTELSALFTRITVPTDMKQEQYESLDASKITVIAQAVQSLGFDDADEAFAEVEVPDIVKDAIAHHTTT